MTFNHELVTRYLKLVNDNNPIHNHIVPGQLIVEKAFLICKVKWKSYSIKYRKATIINENVRFDKELENKITVKNDRNEIKIVITKKV
ncbi:hypothetical protein BUY45_00650 [Staphylococcus devriesei]|uniref:Uncharacterized protein n=1 Tax=Staphylococcus devriesei TaxID=586733 RepID=A0A2T4L2S3_9STAP|nr:hypothetical protein [Staphylococcus devriesei]PTF05208.1 hypothetical protein BUY45_00650 [Staphylococcus devriesei]PTF16142.1 hypothetical protein BUY48_03650 [Staphylococcus devriesei]